MCSRAHIVTDDVQSRARPAERRFDPPASCPSINAPPHGRTGRAGSYTLTIRECRSCHFRGGNVCGGWSPAGMHVLAHALWQQRCLEVALRLHHVVVVDETRRTYRHHGKATRLGASQRSATRRCASHHIATQRLSRWGSPAARARLARTVTLKRLWLRDSLVKRNICERMNSPPRDVPARARVSCHLVPAGGCFRSREQWRAA